MFPFGWTVIRFVADNPGVWTLHCHLDAHLLMGMKVIFVESKSQIPAPPPGLKTCGAIDSLYQNPLVVTTDQLKQLVKGTVGPVGPPPPPELYQLMSTSTTSSAPTIVLAVVLGVVTLAALVAIWLALGSGKGAPLVKGHGPSSHQSFPKENGAVALTEQGGGRHQI
jgi:hypothetical protein